MNEVLVHLTVGDGRAEEEVHLFLKASHPDKSTPLEFEKDWNKVREICRRNISDLETDTICVEMEAMAGWKIETNFNVAEVED